MAKINIISGFLGAGKTTLIKKLLSGAFSGEKVILLENEYGEVGVDGGFMRDAGIQITELNSGCICCTLVGDFTKALDELLDKYDPDRVIIEPSGVGKLSDIRKVVVGLMEEHEDLVLEGSATVADVSKCRMYAKNFGEFFIDQIENAETIILSRTQTASEDKIEKCVELLRQYNAEARIITTPWDDLSSEQVLEVIESAKSLLSTEEAIREAREHHHHEYDEHGVCSCGHHHDDDDEHEHHHHHHDDEECCCGHHHDDEDEHEHHHHHHDDEECCHGHHHDDEDEHEHHHHHDDEECCHGHHHHHDDEECCHGHHHDDDDDEHEHEHHHEHHHHDDHEHHHEHEHEHEHHHHDDDECGCGHHHHDHEHEHHHHDGECGCGHHHHHHADEVFQNIGVETPKKFEEAVIREALARLEDEATYGTILRAKGILPLTDGKWMHFDYVPGESDIRYGSADYTGRLCVIGTDLHENALKELFGI